MLTPFGKRLRKLRIDQGELMKDMAARLGVTPSYLSAVEMGKKPVPDVWIMTIGTQYGLTDVDELQRLAEYAKPEYRVQIPTGADDLTREKVHGEGNCRPAWAGGVVHAQAGVRHQWLRDALPSIPV